MDPNHSIQNSSTLLTFTINRQEIQTEQKMAEENGVLIELLARVIAAGNPTVVEENRKSVSGMSNPLAEDNRSDQDTVTE